jgi:hypothetical protein
LGSLRSAGRRCRQADEVRENFLARLEEGVGVIREIVAKEEKPQKRRFFGLFGR